MQYDDAKLDFAYKYPFSKEAKDIIESLNISKISDSYLKAAKNHIEAALAGGISYTKTNISSVKIDYIVVYAYSRMLSSAYGNIALVKAYAKAEAKRSIDALSLAESEEIDKLGKELYLNIVKRFMPEQRDEFVIKVYDFLKFSPGTKDLELVNQKLSGGAIVLDRITTIKLMNAAIVNEILKGLPIKISDLPSELTTFAKSNRITSQVERAPKFLSRGNSIPWIEKLLSIPIADVRHRTVNLILAPYLTNIKGMSAEDAAKIINSYIEKCKEINPDTKITERYVEYQCNYAKKKGTKPLSEQHARELLGNLVDIWT
ncbi:MAG: DNA primase noncatalytic subunit PriX [Candidatus Micrarchaeia archaeon]